MTCGAWKISVFLLASQLSAAAYAGDSQSSTSDGHSLGKQPPPNAHIVSFSAANPDLDGKAADGATGGSGPLHILYSDGTEVTVANERGDFGDGAEIVPQTRFENILLAKDKQTIGWLAGYMMCAQSYACNMRLVIYRSGRVLDKFAPRLGIVWDWGFRDDGKQVVIHSGFPHGDEGGEYSLYDVKTQRKLASYSLARDAPDWVREFRHGDD